jgi:SAM-dependent methyltransferase
MGDYKLFSDIYEDIIARSNSSDKKINEVLDNIFNKNKVKKIWDNACGSGRQSIFLANKGYNILASDINKYFINGIKKRNIGTNLRLEVRDMKNPPNENFDCVISMFNSICHLSKNDLIFAFKKYKKLLNKEGLLIFDIFNKDYFLKDLPSYRFIQGARERNNKKIVVFNKVRFDKKSQNLKSYLEIYFQEGLKKPVHKRILFRQRLYSLEEIKIILNRSGFSIKKILDPKGKAFNPRKSLFMMIIAKAI